MRQGPGDSLLLCHRIVSELVWLAWKGHARELWQLRCEEYLDNTWIIIVSMFIYSNKCPTLVWVVESGVGCVCKGARGLRELFVL